MTSPDPHIPSIPLDRLDQRLAESRALIASLVKDATYSYRFTSAEETAMGLAAHALHARPDALASLLATAIITLVEQAHPDISPTAGVDWEALAADAEPDDRVPARNDTATPEDVRLRVKAFIDDLNTLTLKHGIAIADWHGAGHNVLRDVTTDEAIAAMPDEDTHRWQLCRNFAWIPLYARYQATEDAPHPTWVIS